MKKLSVGIMLLFVVLITAINCKSDTKKEVEEVKTEVIEEVEAIEKDVDMAMATYQCPMDCEKGKTYDEPGQCPVCKMDIKEVDSDNDTEDHDHEDDSDGK